MDDDNFKNLATFHNSKSIFDFMSINSDVIRNSHPHVQIPFLHLNSNSVLS